MSPHQFYNLDEHEQAEKAWVAKLISTSKMVSMITYITKWVNYL